MAERAGDEAAESRDGEAPIEGEALDAIRLMTIHRAKGLEFPVVCVADTGRLRPHGDDQLVRLGRDGRVALKVAVPGAGKARAALDHAGLLADARAAAAREEERLFYVACTRAEERLLVSGSASFARWPSARQPDLPAGRLAGARARAGDPRPRGRRRRGRGGRGRGLADLAPRDGRPGPAPAGGRRRRSPRPATPAARSRRPPRPSRPGAGALPVDHVSYSSLEDHRRCGYRFYLERVLRLPPRDEPAPRAARRRRRRACRATVRGSIAHLLLERLDMRHPAAPGAARARRRGGRGGYRRSWPTSTAPTCSASSPRSPRSPLRARLADASRVAHEEPFSFALGDLLVTGFLDVLAWEGERALVVDYKTNRLRGREPVAIVEADYAVQRLVYALAALRAGARVGRRRLRVPRARRRAGHDELRRGGRRDAHGGALRAR